MKKISAIAQTFLLTSFSALSLLAAPVQAASFRGLGSLDSSQPSPHSFATDVSANGSVVTGYSTRVNGQEAFRWTQEDGMVGLGGFFSFAEAVSADGFVVVGSTSDNGSRAFRWTQGSGMVRLDDLAGGGFYSIATSVSADGSVIVGSSDSVNGFEEPFRWTQADGMLNLGSLAPDGSYRYDHAYGISADGSVIVGSSYGINGQEAFLWTQAGGIVGLGDLPGSDFYSIATSVSADGSVIVGSSYGVNGFEPFRWTQVDGMLGLGSLASNDSSNDGQAYGVSANGSVVIGSSYDGNEYEAFVWTQAGGMVSLKDTLIGAGLDLSGWDLYSARGVSADGLTIVGDAINPLGQQEAWVANLSPEPVPEPLTILGSIAAIAFAAGFERKFSKNKSDEKDPDA
jgi:probable HAF family extracellular repeat protein